MEALRGRLALQLELLGLEGVSAALLRSLFLPFPNCESVWPARSTTADKFASSPCSLFYPARTAQCCLRQVRAHGSLVLPATLTLTLPTAAPGFSSSFRWRYDGVEVRAPSGSSGAQRMGSSRLIGTFPCQSLASSSAAVRSSHRSYRRATNATSAIQGMIYTIYRAIHAQEVVGSLWQLIPWWVSLLLSPFLSNRFPQDIRLDQRIPCHLELGRPVPP